MSVKKQCSYCGMWFDPSMLNEVSNVSPGDGDHFSLICSGCLNADSPALASLIGQGERGEDATGWGMRSIRPAPEMK